MLKRWITLFPFQEGDKLQLIHINSIDGNKEVTADNLSDPFSICQ